MEEQRRQEYLDRQKKAEEQKKIKDQQERAEIEEKRKRDAAKNDHRQIVKIQMETNEEAKKKAILDKTEEINSKVQKVQSQQKQERKRKAELAALKREDREETVNRITKMNEYRRDKLQEKIETDNDRSAKILSEKSLLVQTRQTLRKKVERQKAKVLEAFEKMKKNGKIDVRFYN